MTVFPSQPAAFDLTCTVVRSDGPLGVARICARRQDVCALAVPHTRTAQPDPPHVHDVGRRLLRGKDARSPARCRHRHGYAPRRRTADESVPEAEPEPEPEPGAQDTTPEETTLIDGKKRKKDKTRKRDFVENEQAAARDDGTAPHGESKKWKKKRKTD